MRDEKYYILALKAAELSECAQKHGAVLARGSTILSVACNREITNAMHGPVRTIHAEQRAIVKARTDLKGTVLYSAHFNGKQVSKPCEMCHELLIEAGIHKVVYFDGHKLVKSKLVKERLKK